MVNMTKLTQKKRQQLEQYSDKIIANNKNLAEQLKKSILGWLNAASVADEYDENTVKDDIQFDGKKVLLVDDDMRNIYALNSLLEEHGVIVTIATSGKESLKLLDENNDIDLVFMDIMMPEMSGVEVIREIRSDDSFYQITDCGSNSKSIRW